MINGQLRWVGFVFVVFVVKGQIFNGEIIITMNKPFSVSSNFQPSTNYNPINIFRVIIIKGNLHPCDYGGFCFNLIDVYDNHFDIIYRYTRIRKSINAFFPLNGFVVVGVRCIELNHDHARFASFILKRGEMR